MNLAELFSIALFHPYYADKRSQDFLIEPTPETDRLLKGHRLYWKNSTNRISIIATANEENKPFIALEEGLTFSFLLKQRSNRFIAFTELSDPTLASTYYYSNANRTTPGTAELELATEVPEGAPSTRDFGIIQVYNNGSLPTLLDEPSEFFITFEERKERWRYYILSHKTNPQFSIEDTTGTLTFAHECDLENDVTFEQIQKAYPGYNLLLFASQEALPFQEYARLGINLQEDGKTLIENLPMTAEGFHLINLIAPGSAPPQVINPIPDPEEPLPPGEDNLPAAGLSFDGQKTYVSVPVLEPDTNITHEFWFKTTNDNRGIFSYYTGIPGERGTGGRQIYTKSKKLYVALYRQGSIASEALTINDGQWHHIAHVISHQKGQTLYLDGKLIIQGTENQIELSKSGSIVAGYAKGAKNDFFKGEISEVRVWKCTRTLEQIRAAMHQRLKGSEKNLLLYWPLNEGEGTTAYDRSGNQLHGTIRSGTW